jgi:hypothetical protein
MRVPLAGISSMIIYLGDNKQNEAPSWKENNLSYKAYKVSPSFLEISYKLALIDVAKPP